MWIHGSRSKWQIMNLNIEKSTVIAERPGKLIIINQATLLSNITNMIDETIKTK